LKISLFIPTYNASRDNKNRFIATLDIIKQANLYRVLIIDSSSSDDTVDIVNSYGFESKIIPKEEFDHSGTRQLALTMLSDSDIIIYMTQDALIVDIDALNRLIEPFYANQFIAATYGRQLPHADADIFAKILRGFNYGSKNYIRSYADRYVWGMRCVFASDSFAAYSVDALQHVGGFPERLIFGEDTYIFAKLLRANYKVAYVADSVCYHSHNYCIRDEFTRSFDIGVFHRSENWILRDFGYPNKLGIKLVLSEWKTVIFFKPWLLPKSYIRICAKYLGYKLGYNYDKIGVRLSRKFSMNSSFWW
jgi:rhamnosyltransferase